MATYSKLEPDEPIQIGDLISLVPISNKVVRSSMRDKMVVGVCVDIKENNITVKHKGIFTLNVSGFVCLGDKLTTSREPGKAAAMKYDQNESQFGIKSIGKVIGLYNDYSQAKVLLDIE